MSLPRARIVRAQEATRGVPLLSPGLGPEQKRRLARETIEAHLTAERLVADATARAEALLRDAAGRAEAAVESARREARAEADVALAGRWLALRQAEARRTGDEERVIAVAVALAERLLGAALELEPSRIADLARAVFAEARGARRATVHAHPLDAGPLRDHLSTVGIDPESVTIECDEALARGALRLHTDVGIIDAQLSSRLDRLADALREALR